MKSSFKNWSEAVIFNPSEILYPSTEAEISSIIKKANTESKKIRVVGSGHSFTPLIATNDVLISLDNLKGLIHASKESGEAEVFAGTKLYDLGPMLQKEGLSVENMGDIDKQSVAGAFSTSTHGTGVNFGVLATQVLAITLINGQGEIIRLEKEIDGDAFKAAQVSMGMLGIITRMKLRLLPSYKLEYITKKSTLNDVLENYESYNASNRNFEFYWFPHTEVCQLKFVNVTDKEPSSEGARKWNILIMENYAFKVLSEISRLFSIPKFISKISAAGVSPSHYVNWSYKVFASDRLVKFQEMEFNIPREHFKTVIQEIKTLITEQNIKVHFPIECRVVKEDTILISPAYGRESAYIAIHMYKGMEYKSYFDEVQKIFMKYNGRPHWGKMHFCTKAYFEKQYPQWNTFSVIREKFDPKNIFLNTHLSELFGK